MKRIMSIFTVIIIAATIFCGCGRVADVKVDIGESKNYTENDRNKVAEDIKEIFYKNYDRCTLHTIKYAGDEWSKEDLSYCKELRSKEYTECMVFLTDFHSPKENGPDDAWNEDEEYTYNWHFAKEKSGNWEYICAGQG